MSTATAMYGAAKITIDIIEVKAPEPFWTVRFEMVDELGSSHQFNVNTAGPRKPTLRVNGDHLSIDLRQ